MTPSIKEKIIFSRARNLMRPSFSPSFIEPQYFQKHMDTKRNFFSILYSIVKIMINYVSLICLMCIRVIRYIIIPSSLTTLTIKMNIKVNIFPFLSWMRNSTHDHEGPLPFCKQNRNDTFSIEMAVLTFVKISS